jgi:hypothetical protein
LIISRRIMLKKLTYLYALLGIGSVVTFSGTAHAADLALPIPVKQGLSGDADTGSVISGLASNVISIVFLIAGILAVLFLLYSGVQYITAGGDPEKVKKARLGIVNAVIGVVVIMAAFFIIRIATSTRGAFDNNGSVSGTTAGGGGGTGTTTGGIK